MRYYLNDASLQGQFEDEVAFRPILESLLAARSRSPVVAAMRTTPALANRPVTQARSVRDVVQSWRGSAAASAFMAWVGRNGPFIEEDRLAEIDDLFYCMGIDVTDGGLGEATRRVKAEEAVATMSFPGGASDFSQSPLGVTHGFEEAPISTYNVDNFWDSNVLIAAALQLAPPAVSWETMVINARASFPRLTVPDDVWRHDQLACEPFSAVIRDRFYALLSQLDRYMSGRNPDGSEGPIAQEVVRLHFNGDRALFSPESPSNRATFAAEMTFPDPEGGSDIFAHWHGKISHRYFRVHFEWPVPATANTLKVLYAGPKLTKS